MSERRWGVASYALIGAGIVAAASVVAYQEGIQGATIAAWVQAVGSIAAIVGAFILGARQQEVADRREAEKRARADRESLLAIELLVKRANHFCKVTLNKARKGAADKGDAVALIIFSRRLSVLLTEQISRVPMHQMPYAQVSVHLIGCQTYLEYFMAAADGFSKAGEAEMEQWLKAMDTWHRRHQRALKDFQKELAQS